MICGGQSGTATVFSPSTCVFPVYHSTNAPYSSTCYFYQDKRAKAGDLLKSNVLSEVGEHWTHKHMHLVVEGFIFILLCLCKGWSEVTSWTCIWKVRTFVGPQTVLTRCLCFVSALRTNTGAVPRLGVTTSFLPSFVRDPFLFADQQLPCHWMPCSIHGLKYSVP